MLRVAKSGLYMLAALLVFVALPARAEWSKSFEVGYIMGDGDNRASARQAALEQIKLKASGEAGTYILSTTTLRENGDLTENIQIIGASLVKIVESEESLSVNQSGQAVLLVKATTSLDERELTRRVELLQQDKEKARQVKLLQAENEVLRGDLAQIRNALAAKSDPSKIAGLLSRQDSTIKRLEDNGRTLTLVFERGALLKMASHSSDAYEKAILALDGQFFAPIMQSPITAVIESVEASVDGYVALVRVGWSVDAKRARSVLARYLRVTPAGGNVLVSAFENLQGKGPSALSERIYQHLVEKGVDLQLQIAGKSVRLPMFYSDDGFMEGCGLYSKARAGNAKYLCLVSQGKNSPEIRGFASPLSNPIRIHLTREEVEHANVVEASWIEAKKL